MPTNSMTAAASKIHKFGFIDALRGYAILGVWIVHVGGAWPALEFWTVWGRYGVHLFFTVSAFTLAMSWSERHQTTAAFFVRRLFRIAPMFWTAIALYTMLNVIGFQYLIGETITETFSWLEIAATAAFLVSFHPHLNNLVVPGDWSVGVEVTFYVLFPFIIRIVTSWRRAIVFVVLSAVLYKLGTMYNARVLSAIFPNQSVTVLSGFWWTSLPATLLCFATGLLAYHLFDPLHRAIIKPVVVKLGFAVTLLALVFCLLKLQQTPIMLLFGALVLALSRNQGSVLNNAGVRHIGRISFSGYLLHWLFLVPATNFAQALTTNAWAGFILALVIVSAATTLLATMSYYCIEQPFIRLGAKLARKVDWVAGEPTPVFPSTSLMSTKD